MFGGKGDKYQQIQKTFMSVSLKEIQNELGKQMSHQLKLMRYQQVKVRCKERFGQGFMEIFCLCKMITACYLPLSLIMQMHKINDQSQGEAISVQWKMERTRLNFQFYFSPIEWREDLNKEFFSNSQVLGIIFWIPLFITKKNIPIVYYISNLVYHSRLNTFYLHLK